MRIKFAFDIRIRSCLRIVVGIICAIVIRLYTCLNAADIFRIFRGLFLYLHFPCILYRSLCGCIFGICKISEIISALLFCLCHSLCLCILHGSSCGRRINLIGPVRKIPEFCEISCKILLAEFGGKRGTFNTEFQAVSVFDKLEWFYQCRISHGNLVCGGMLERAADLINTIVYGICICFFIKCTRCCLQKLNALVYHGL